MSTRDLSDMPRWLESGSDAPTELRAALTELAGSDDDGALLARLETRLSPLWGTVGVAEPPVAGPEAAASASVAAPAGTVATGVALKAGALVLLGAGAIATAFGVSRVEPREPAQRLPAPAASTPRPSLVLPANVEPVPAAPRPSSSSPPAASPVAARSPVHRPSTVAPVEPAPSVADEARLLRSAREATGTSLERALSLLAEHERKFPRGELREERELFAVDVLVRAGRTDEAVARVERLRRLAPGSPHLVAAERLVAKTSAPR
jgi:hypothetical protein